MPDQSCTGAGRDRKSTRLNSSHLVISYAVFCLKKKNIQSQAVLRSYEQAVTGGGASVVGTLAWALRHGCSTYDVECRSLRWLLFFFFNDTATTEIYTLSLHDALPI